MQLLADLTDREQELIVAAHNGTELVCSDLSVEELATSDDPRHRIRAELIRELLLGRRGDLDPRGVHISRARIAGQLDLSHALVSSTATGGGAQGTICLAGATVTGDLTCGDSVLTNASGPAVVADGARLGGYLSFVGGRVTTADGDVAAVRLPGMSVDWQLRLDNIQLANTSSGLLVDLQDVTVKMGLVLPVSVICPGNGHYSSRCAGRYVRPSGLVLHLRRTTRPGTVAVGCGRRLWISRTANGRRTVAGFVRCQRNGFCWLGQPTPHRAITRPNAQRVPAVHREHRAPLSNSLDSGSTVACRLP